MKKALSWMFIISILYSLFLFFLKTHYLDHLEEKTASFFFLLLIAGFMWIPGITALIFSKKENIYLPIFKKPGKYILYACFVPVAITLLSFLISFLFAPFQPMDLSNPNLAKLCFFTSPTWNYFILGAITLFSGILIGGTVNILTTLGEELMWRGYLFEKLKHVGFWKSSSIIGILWGLWHVPLIVLIGLNYPHHPILGSFWMIIGTVLLSPVMQYLRLKGGSILLTCIFHGIFNRTAALSLIFFVNANQLLVGPVGISGFIALGMVNMVLYKKYKNTPLHFQ
ncbi:MAG: CPBP family intramembrane glutamic endopeptidase [Chlamydiota bacterium]